MNVGMMQSIKPASDMSSFPLVSRAPYSHLAKRGRSVHTPDMPHISYETFRQIWHTLAYLFCRNVRCHVFAETSFAETSFAETSFAETSFAETSFAETSFAETSFAETSFAETSGIRGASNTADQLRRELSTPRVCG